MFFYIYFIILNIIVVGCSKIIFSIDLLSQKLLKLKANIEWLMGIKFNFSFKFFKLQFLLFFILLLFSVIINENLVLLHMSEKTKSCLIDICKSNSQKKLLERFLIGQDGHQNFIYKNFTPERKALSIAIATKDKENDNNMFVKASRNWLSAIDKYGNTQASTCTNFLAPVVFDVNEDEYYEKKDIIILEDKKFSNIRFSIFLEKYSKQNSEKIINFLTKNNIIFDLDLMVKLNPKKELSQEQLDFLEEFINLKSNYRFNEVLVGPSLLEFISNPCPITFLKWKTMLLLDADNSFEPDCNSKFSNSILVKKVINKVEKIGLRTKLNLYDNIEINNNSSFNLIKWKDSNED